jgi:hypothetical protein
LIHGLPVVHDCFRHQHMMMILASVLCECIPVFGLVIHTINSSFGQLVEVSSQHRTHIFRTDPHPYPINFGPVDVFCSLHRLSLFRIGDTIFGFMALLSIVTNTCASCPFLCSIAVISSSAPICHGAVWVGCVSRCRFSPVFHFRLVLFHLPLGNVLHR